MSIRPPIPPGPYLVVGLARSGVAASLALAEAIPGARIMACDTGRPEGSSALGSRLERSGVEVHFESDGLELIECEVAPRTLVKSPGVPKEASVVSAAQRAGIQVIGELELAWRMLDNRFCAVTGTNGKTTTCEMLGALFTASGEPVEVAGNIGSPLSSLAGRVDKNATIVCEASSFQLEDTVEFAPDAAVFLNAGEDHLDRHGSKSNYLQAKLRIFLNQHRDGLAIMNAAEAELIGTDKPGAGREIWFGLSEPCREHGRCSAYVEDGEVHWQGDRLFSVADLKVRGSHNLENALAAVSAGIGLGLDKKSVSSAICKFPGVRHRLEEVAEIDGTLYVNDSKATNVEATLVALEAFESGVQLILGGSLKGAGFKKLREPVGLRSRACYLIGEAAEKIKDDLAGSGVPIKMCGDLDVAVAEAASSARQGDVVLLAPACASFDQFKDFEERGDRFVELVEGLKGQK